MLSLVLAKLITIDHSRIYHFGFVTRYEKPIATLDVGFKQYLPIEEEEQYIRGLKSSLTQLPMSIIQNAITRFQHLTTITWPASS